MFWELYQQSKTADAKDSAEKAHLKVEGYETEIEKVRDQMNRLAFACQSLWELVREKTDLTEKDLQKKILEVDLRDGRINCKMGAKNFSCPACSRNTNSKQVPPASSAVNLLNVPISLIHKETRFRHGAKSAWSSLRIWQLS
jgi:hypothetical protein